MQDGEEDGTRNGGQPAPNSDYMEVLPSHQQHFNNMNAYLGVTDPTHGSIGDVHNTTESDDLFNKLIVNLNNNSAL